MVWNSPLPTPVTVKEAAQVERTWYGKAVTPFAITLLTGSRTGLEFDEKPGICVPPKISKASPCSGLTILPYSCCESLSKRTSATHLAVATGKSMDDCMATGRAVGVADALAAEQGIVPREVNVRKLQDTLRAAGVNFDVADRDQSGLKS